MFENFDVAPGNFAESPDNEFSIVGMDIEGVLLDIDLAHTAITFPICSARFRKFKS